MEIHRQWKLQELLLPIALAETKTTRRGEMKHQKKVRVGNWNTPLQIYRKKSRSHFLEMIDFTSSPLVELDYMFVSGIFLSFFHNSLLIYLNTMRNMKVILGQWNNITCSEVSLHPKSGLFRFIPVLQAPSKGWGPHETCAEHMGYNNKTPQWCEKTPHIISTLSRSQFFMGFGPASWGCNTTSPTPTAPNGSHHSGCLRHLFWMT